MIELQLTQKDIDRFWSKVDHRGPDECWEWTGARHSKDEYGNFSIKHQAVLSHRVAWVIANKRQVPEGLMICHSCDNPPCCNPNHLFAGTQVVNVEDRHRKGRDGAAWGIRNGAYTRPDRVRRGETNGRSKISDAEAIQLREKRANGALLRDLVEQFRLSIAQISKIARGDARKR